MSIISISRASLGAGQTLAELVAQRLGYRCVGSEALIAAATGHGVSEPEITKVLETRPSFWERLSSSREWYVTVLRVAMCEIARDGDLVYHGLAGQELLKGVSHVVRLRVIAPPDQRIRSVMEARHISAEAAKQSVQQVDEDRLHRMRHLFGLDWRDPALYDAVINLEQMTLESAAALTIELAGRPEYQPTPASIKRLNDIELASRVKSTVMERFDGASLDVTADDGHVRLRGTLQGLADDREALVDVVKAMPRVKDVQAEVSFQAMPYYIAP